jgi:DNA helicase-2/ATP-dependent DNA helicase PcrA
VIETSGIEPWYCDHDPEKAQDRVANIRELASAAEAYREAHADQGLSGFLDHVALVTSADSAADDRDQLRLMTIHAAKGLEFPIVFIVGLEQDVFPLARGRVIQDLEEERRLMYVGITRAKECLYLSWARTRSLYGETKRNEPSQFLAEIPAVCLRQRDASGRRQAPAPSSRPGPFQRSPNPRPGRPADAPPGDDADAGQDPVPPAGSTATFSAGDLIIHQAFGRGRILGFKHVGAERALVVHFDHHGMKQLNPGLAAARMRLVEE